MDCAFLFHVCAKFMFGKATRERLLITVGRLLSGFEAQLDVLSVSGVANSTIGGGGHIFIYSRSAQLISFEIDCFHGL